MLIDLIALILLEIPIQYLIDIYSFMPVSGCVGIGPSMLLYPGAYNAVKTDLIYASARFDD